MKTFVASVCLIFAIGLVSCGPNTYQQPTKSAFRTLDMDTVQVKADEYNTIFERRYGLLFKTFANDPFTGRIITFENENGRDYIATDESYKDGRRDDLSIRWFSSGQKMYERNYSDGKWDGLVIRWWPNGQKMYVRAYADGIRHGRETTWRSDGTQIDLSTPVAPPIPVSSSPEPVTATIEPGTSGESGDSKLPDLQDTLTPSGTLPSLSSQPNSESSDPTFTGGDPDSLPSIPTDSNGITSGVTEPSEIPALPVLPDATLPPPPPVSAGGEELSFPPLDTVSPPIPPSSPTSVDDGLPGFPPLDAAPPITPPDLPSQPTAPSLPPPTPVDANLPSFPPLEGGTEPAAVDSLPGTPTDTPVLPTPEELPGSLPAPSGETLPAFPPLDSTVAPPPPPPPLPSGSGGTLETPPPPPAPIDSSLPPAPFPPLDDPGDDADGLPPLPKATPSGGGDLPPLPPLP